MRKFSNFSNAVCLLPFKAFMWRPDFNSGCALQKSTGYIRKYLNLSCLVAGSCHQSTPRFIMKHGRQKRAISRVGYVDTKLPKNSGVRDCAVTKSNEEGDVSTKCKNCATQFSIKTSTEIKKACPNVHEYQLGSYDQKRFTIKGYLVNSLPVPLVKEQMAVEKNLL